MAGKLTDQPPILIDHPLGRLATTEAPFIRSVQILRIYDAPSLPRKDNRFDQELPSIRGSKVWRKGSRPVAWLDGMVEALVSVEFTAKLWSLHHIPGYRIS